MHRFVLGLIGLIVVFAGLVVCVSEAGKGLTRELEKASSERKQADAAGARAEAERKIAEGKAREEAERKEFEAWKARNPRATKILKEHPDWSRDDCETISNRKVRIGMTAEMCRLAWGQPSDVNRTTSSFGTHEQWVYGEYSHTYLYFRDGVLEAVQN